MRVLVVEDDEEYVDLIRHVLTADSNGSSDVTVVTRVTDAVAELGGDPGFDVVLLDLNLPDSTGVDTVTHLVDKAPLVPVVVLTGARFDEPAAVAALRAGAQDFLLKGEEDVLVTALERSIARHQHLIDAIDRTRTDALDQRTSEALAKLAGAVVPVTELLLGVGPLRESLPMLFDRFVRQYMAALDEAVDSRAYKNAGDGNAAGSTLGREFAQVGAAPRDVIDVHTTALRMMLRSVKEARARIVLEEARMVLLAVMGHLANTYRASSRHRPATTEDT